MMSSGAVRASGHDFGLWHKQEKKHRISVYNNRNSAEKCRFVITELFYDHLV